MAYPELTPELTDWIERYLEGNATAEQRQAVLDWYRNADHAEIRVPVASMTEMDEIRQRVRAALATHVSTTRTPRRAFWQKIAVAAAVLLVFAGGGWLWRQNNHPAAPTAIATTPLNDALPGHNGAILTLANGAQKILDSLPDGAIAVQGATVVNLRNGSLDYETTATAGTALTYNTISTPRGRQYQLTLPDGTKVWLNAASKLTYPTAFVGTQREVELEGEAYFEVKHDRKPFRVKANGQMIEDLGTAFNINAYGDEPATVTTLVEGAVRVNDRLLQPGEQAVTVFVGGEPGPVKVEKANIDQTLAWKNDAFSFTNASLQSVLRQLARWYDVDIEYQGEATKRVFSGEIGRGLTLNQVLRLLTRSHIHYQIENGNRLIILPGDE